MSRLPPAQAEAALEHVAEQFTHWRQTRAKARERIPRALWTQAVSLTRILPISRVAKRLGLYLTDLKKRRAGKPPAVAVPATPAPLTFVEVTAPAAPPRPLGIEVEVQRPDGARLRLTAGEATAALTALVRTFWEPHS